MKASHSVLAVALFLSWGCAQGGQGFGIESFGAGILGSTGLVSSSQASALFKAGSQFAKAAEGLTEEQEYFLGRGVSATVFSHYPAVRNEALNRYLNKVGSTVAAFSDRPETFGGYHFMALNSPEINAMAAPGGFVFVTDSFLKRLPDEDALAAVLAHEVAHIVLGHGVKAVSQANLTGAFSGALTVVGEEVAASHGGAGVSTLVSTFGGSVTEVTDTLLVKGYSRSQEYEADAYAAALLRKSGYNPKSILTVLETLKTMEGAGGGWFSTHPSAEKRIRELKGEIPDFQVSPEAQRLRAARFKSAINPIS